MNGLIPKQEIKSRGLRDYLLYVSILTFIAAVVCFVIFHYYSSQTSGLVQLKDEELSKIGTEEQKISADKVLKYEKKIRDFSRLISKRKYSVNFIKFLEESTLQGVVIHNMSLDIPGNKALLKGRADSFQTLGRQEDFFKNNEMVVKTYLSNTSMGQDSKVSFNFDLDVSPDIFGAKD